MSRFKRGNKLDMETILVAYCPSGTDQAFAKGNALVDGTTALGIADGQLGCLSWDNNGTVPFGTFLSGGEVTTDVRAIKVLQGTPASSNIVNADPWEVGDKGYLESGILRRDNIRSITVHKCRNKGLSTIGVTDFAAVQENVEYRFFTSVDSVRNQVQFGYNGQRVHAGFTTPDYPSLSIVDRTDHLLQNLLADFNKQSKAIGLSNGSRSSGNAPVIAFAVNLAGGSGQAIGTITCGTSIDVMNDFSVYCDEPTQTVTSSIVADEAMVKGLAYLIAKQARAQTNGWITTPITATSTIEVIDLSTAGDAANVDAFIIVGLEHELSKGVDKIPQTLPNININFGGAGFIADEGPNRTCTPADEGAGYGRNWIINAEERFQRNVHSMYVDDDRGSVYQSGGVSYLSPSNKYTSITIEYYDHEDTLTLQKYDPKLLTILVCGSTACDTVTNTAANFTTNLGVQDTVPFVPGNLVDISTTVEVACCPNIVAAPLLEADLAGVLLTWLADADANFNNGLEFDDFTALGAESNLFTLAGI